MKLIRYLCYGQGKYAVCDNNCKGVNPNAIIGAGVAAVGIIGISAQAIAGPAAGIGLGGLAGRYIRVLDYVIRYGYAYCQAQSPNPKSQILKSKELDFG